MTESAGQIYDYAFLGCGISALVAAKYLSRDSRILVIDHYPEPGGNHQSFILEGMEFDIGSIYFNTLDEQFRFFPELLKQCVAKDIKVKKICPDGSIADYPFDWKQEVSALGFMARLACALSIVKCRLFIDKHDSSSSYARSRIGEVLYRRVGLDTYIHRLFGIDGEHIDVDFGLKRMQWLARETSLRYRLKRRVNAIFSPRGRSETLVRPPGGFGQYYRNVLAGLRESGVDFVFGEAPTSINCASLPMEITTERQKFLVKQIISTIPLAQISHLCDSPPIDLPTITLLSLFVALRGTWKPKCSVLHNFHSVGEWKRITVHSDFYQSQTSYDKHFTVEIAVPSGYPVPDAQSTFERFKAHIGPLDLVDGSLELIGSVALGNAYPIPEKGFKEQRDTAVKALAAKGIICLGRQGKFEYLPHSNVAAKEAVVTLKRALSFE